MAITHVATYNTEGTALHCAYQSNYLYIADTNGGGASNLSFLILDVSDIDNPTKAGGLALLTSYKVHVSGSYAYVACNDGTGYGCKIIDISTPTSPSQTGTMITTQGRGIYTSGNYAYLGSYLASNGFHVYDITSKSGNKAPSATLNIAYCQSVFVSGNYCYVATAQNGLKIIDISSPTSPSVVATYDDGTDILDVYVSGNYAYLAYNAAKKMVVLDITDPTNPSLSGSISSSVAVKGVFYNNNYVHTANYTNGLKVYNVSDKVTPVLSETYSTGDAEGLCIDGDYAFVADGTNGIIILNIEDYAEDDLTYKIRIGTYPGTENTDYWEFDSDGDPMPSFGQGRTNVYNEKAEIVAVRYLLPMRMLLPSSNSVDTLWTKWDRMVSMLDNTVQDIRIYYDDTLKRAYLKGETSSGTTVGCIRSPRIISLDPQVSRGTLVTKLEFDATIFIETGFSTHGVDIVELSRTITETTTGGVTTREGSITAKGPGAEAKVLAFKSEVGTDDQITFEQITEQRDQDRYTATYRIERPSGSGSSISSETVSITEDIIINPGGRDKKFELITGDNNPIEFDGAKKPYIVSISGTTVSKTLEGIMIPDRRGFPGYVSGAYQYSYKTSESVNKDGSPRTYTADYQYTFMLPNSAGVDQIITGVSTLINPIPGVGIDDFIAGALGL